MFILFAMHICIEDANTTALSDSVVAIAEGDNGTISCRSVGAPVPSITWEFNNQTTGFEQADTVTPHEAALTGEPPTRVVDLTPGNTVSTLHIVSARYPDHDGVYTCIGTNADDLTVASSSAFANVQVHGKIALIYNSGSRLPTIMFTTCRAIELFKTAIN